MSTSALFEIGYFLQLTQHIVTLSAQFDILVVVALLFLLPSVIVVVLDRTNNDTTEEEKAVRYNNFCLHSRRIFGYTMLE